MLKGKFIDSQQGSTMVMVLMVMVVLLILGTALISTSVAENRFVVKNEDRIQAYYIARTGAQAVAEYIIQGDASEIIGLTSEPNTRLVEAHLLLPLKKMKRTMFTTLFLPANTMEPLRQQKSVFPHLAAG
jgi:flagellar basal body-associated protein FliL